MGKYSKYKPGKVTIISIASLVTGLCIGGAITYTVINGSTTRIQNKYNLLAKRVLIDNPNDILLDFSLLQSQLENYSKSNLDNDRASIYFEYLPTGTSIGINEKEQLVGASLLKTPLAINLYKASEAGVIDIDKPIRIKKEWLNDQYGDLYKKGEGYQSSLRQLAEIMLKDSDNTAALAVYNSLAEVMPIDKKLMSFIDSEFGVNKDSSIRLGSETYSHVLKCLYFTCYANKDSSQEILSYLIEANDSSRLRLYLPKDIQVAHKIGTYSAEGMTPIQSDCGIIYLPNRNYILCVMVKGDDPGASKSIGEISRIVYSYIKNSK